MLIFGVILIASLFILACGNSNTSSEDKAKIIKEYQDSIAFVEKAKQDSINSLTPEIKVNVYIRKGIFYDDEGWPVESGKVVLINDFQEKKEYQLNPQNGYDDRIEKIEIIGQSDDITLQFINGESKKIVHEEKAISINGSKTYSNSDPFGQEQIYYQKWLKDSDYNLIIKVSYRNKNIFEGKINPSKQ